MFVSAILIDLGAIIESISKDAGAFEGDYYQLPFVVPAALALHFADSFQFAGAFP
jgi:hypothetical protein